MSSAPAAAAPRRVLFVCHANTSRSIIAEAVLLRLLRERGLERAVTVSSGGIAPFARDGSLVSLDAKLLKCGKEPDAVSSTGSTGYRNDNPHLRPGARAEGFQLPFRKS